MEAGDVSGKRWIGIGCGLLLVCAAVAAVSGYFLLRHLGEDPQGIVVSLEGPLEVRLGEEFTVTVVVENQRPGNFRLRPARTGVFRGDVDVCEGFQFLTTLAQIQVVEKE